MNNDKKKKNISPQINEIAMLGLNIYNKDNAIALIAYYVYVFV